MTGGVPRAPRRIGRWLLLAVIVAASAALLVRWRRSSDNGANGAASATAPVPRLVPEGTRIRVEVLNASDTRGLARRAMFVLRDAGFDVVYFGNTAERAESTVVLDRSGHPDWAALAVKAIGGGRVDSQPDSARYLDLTILVGRRWTPPGESLYP